MPRSPFELSSRLVEESADLDPLLATELGIPGHDHEWPDFGPSGIDARRELVSRYLAVFRPHLHHPDPRQRLAARVAFGRLEEARDQFDHDDHLYDVSHMVSSFEDIRKVFDLMDMTTSEGITDVVRRLETIDRAFGSYQEKLIMAIGRKRMSSVRQTVSLIEQADALAGETSAFVGLAPVAEAAGFERMDRMHAAIDHARRAAGAFGGFLREFYLPLAVDDDGVGLERYRRSAGPMVGFDLDPEEAYAWGWEELERLRAEMATVGEALLPGASIDGVAAHLSTDPERSAPSHGAFVEFVQARLAQALSDLDGEHFDVPAPVKRVTVNIAPAGGPLGAYYQRPTEDFTRPGGVWYSLPAADGPVPLFQEVSTAYHEGFPGHHLQLALTMCLEDELSRYQRSMVWYPGYGEGWALYAERLMRELGYFEKPEYLFGMLASHVFRATRVVVDIGTHLGLEVPAGAPLHPGERWSFELAVEYMHRIGLQPPDYAESEVLRYLGWPGQAISYKLGERAMLDIRSQARRREGEAFDLRDFHRRVLEAGPTRFDTLRDVVLGAPSGGG